LIVLFERKKRTLQTVGSSLQSALSSDASILIGGSVIMPHLRNFFNIFLCKEKNTKEA
jgi:hypothetical protein